MVLSFFWHEPWKHHIQCTVHTTHIQSIITVEKKIDCCKSGALGARKLIYTRLRSAVCTLECCACTERDKIINKQLEMILIGLHLIKIASSFLKWLNKQRIHLSFFFRSFCLLSHLIWEWRMLLPRISIKSHLCSRRFLSNGKCYDKLNSSAWLRAVVCMLCCLMPNFSSSTRYIYPMQTKFDCFISRKNCANKCDCCSCH